MVYISVLSFLNTYYIVFMKWVEDYHLFLFDFDGLLVNTEHVHYQAYVNTLSARGYVIDWSFEQFCEVAHLNATALKEALYIKFPDLDPNWDRVYAEKKANYLQLIEAGQVELMPGVAPLLEALAEKKIRRCVVTNSLQEQIDLICQKIPLLQTIPHFITREYYTHAKPSPECYLKAIALYGKAGDRIIGFEDSVRGLQALKQTSALPVLICPSNHPLIEKAMEGGSLHYESFKQMSDSGVCLR